MGRLYIYLHENHKNQANVGKYTIQWMLWDMTSPPANQLKGFTIGLSNTFVRCPFKRP